MKKWICLVVAAAVSCNSREQPQDVGQELPGQSAEWITYEGRVPLSEKNALYIEVSLRSSNDINSGEFQLLEFLEDQNSVQVISSFKGEYTTLRGQSPDDRIIQFHHTGLARGVTRTYLAPAQNHSMIREEPFRTKDLAVKISGKDRLLVLDNNMKVASDEPDHNLVRRLSRPFTIEGYFRHNGFSADFAEINTGENWKVTKYGEYEKAIRQYYQLTEKKFDVTYLKGIGFPIRRKAQDGKEEEALVIKKVLQMTSAPAVNSR